MLVAGVERSTDLSLVPGAVVGDIVVTHAGYAISVHPHRRATRLSRCSVSIPAEAPNRRRRFLSTTHRKNPGTSRDGNRPPRATICVVNETRSVRGVGAGLSDPAVFRAFYDEALPVVYGYFFKRCGGRREVAADLAQDTFLAAVKAVRSGATVETPIPWIVTIARRRLVDFYRRKASRAVSLGEWAEPTVSVGSQWTSVTETRLASALEQVPADHRLVLVLRYVDDLPVAAVARLIGRSVRATESLLSRARRSLEAAFEEADDV